MSAADNFARLFIRADWMAEAACRDMDVNMFFPERGRNGTKARMICAGCPVADECRKHAEHHNERHGIWGGESRGRPCYETRQKLRAAS